MAATKPPDNDTIPWQELLARLRERFQQRENDGAFVLGITAGVAAGKTTFAETLREKMASWPERPSVEIVSTDGFLFPNKLLAEKQLSTRKGFPESYDVAALADTIAKLRRKTPAKVPLYRMSPMTSIQTRGRTSKAQTSPSSMAF